MRVLALLLACLAACDPKPDECGGTDLVGDGVDQDCDGIDGVDADRDAHASVASGGDDCDDAVDTVHPDAEDACNDVDDDCSGVPDDGPGSSIFYRDADADGAGLDGDTRPACAAPAGYAAVGGDCDDGRAVVHPGATEACNGWDDDCDGAVDGPGAVGFADWYLDGDGDGFGDPGVATAACDAPALHVLDATDCDDADAGTHPGAEEWCDGADQDCDTVADDEAVDAEPWAVDLDGDLHGDDATAVLSCEPMAGRVAALGDCDDVDAGVHPGADELCDGQDDDCDTLVDDADPDGAGSVWFADVDGDGHGDWSAADRACSRPAAHVATPDDCDDTDVTVFVGATEVPGDGIDQDCDGGDPPDFDRDGWAPPDDCDDSDPNLSPTASDITGDAIDQNCDGVDGTDVDRDGDASLVSGGTDCDDHAATIYAGATEILGDGLDNGCKGVVDERNVTEATGWVVGLSEPDRFGDAVAMADFDGDGAMELVAGAPERYDGSLVGNSLGAVAIFPGTMTGEHTALTAAATIVGVNPTGNLGEWVGALPDLSGDGLPELAVGDPAQGSGEGAVYLWFTPPAGTVDANTADVVLLGGYDAAVSRAVAGDLTGDGIDDVLVLYADNNNYGGAQLVAGPLVAGKDVDVSKNPVASITNATAYEMLDQATIADFDGDGFDDVAVASPFFDAGNPVRHTAGRISLLYGPIAGLLPVESTADVQILGSTAGGRLGAQLDAADLDGDGRPELLTGSPEYQASTYRGRIWIFDQAGMVPSMDDRGATATLDGESNADRLGADVVPAGDLDGDGFADLLVGSGYGDQAWFVRGPFVGATTLGDHAYGTITGTPGGGLGERDTLALGDADGDGSPDLWLGEPTNDAEALDGGAVWLLPSAW